MLDRACVGDVVIDDEARLLWAMRRVRGTGVDRDVLEAMRFLVLGENRSPNLLTAAAPGETFSPQCAMDTSSDA